MANKDVLSVELNELTGNPAGAGIISNDQVDLIKGVRVQLRAMLGHAHITVGELFQLAENSVLKLDVSTSAPVDLMLDNKVIARGALVVVDENFGLQITEVIKV